MNALKIAREIFPNEEDDFLDYVLWEETGFPSFFHDDPEKELRQQLLVFKKKLDEEVGIQSLRLKLGAIG